MLRWAIVAAAMLAALPAVPSGPGSESRQSATTSYSVFVSSVAMATLLAKQSPDGTARMDLLVLWRGAPGWFFRPGGRSSGGGGSAGATTARLSYGGVDLNVSLIEDPRVVQILGRPVTLNPPDANVLLVDGVDSPAGPTVVQALRVDPSMPDGTRSLESVLKRSTEIVSFINCEARLPESDSRLQAAVDRLCQAIGGR